MMTNTSRFLSASTGNTERTSYYGDLPEGLAYQLNMKKQQQNKVSSKADDTTGMDLTTCVGAPSEIISTETVNQPKATESKANAGEQTCFFSGNDGGNMEMTECLSQQPSALPAVNQQSSISLKQPPNSQNSSRLSFGEETRLFRADIAGDMELTECQTRFQPPTKVQLAKVEDSDDHTRIYQSDDQCGMELTGNHSKISAGHQGSNQLEMAQSKPEHYKVNTTGFEMMRSQRTADDDKTVVFGGQEDADMEMTTCVGALPPSNQPTHSAIKQSGADLSRLHEDRTHFFQAEDTAKMEMTACIGAFPNVHPSSNQSSQSRPEDDHTRIFETEDTANMEMTTCVGTLPRVQLPTVQSGHSSVRQSGSDPTAMSDDRTHFFQAEDTANMEMTACVGTLPSIHPGQKAVKNSQDDPAPFCDDRTRIFQTDDTGNMDITTCSGMPINAMPGKCSANGGLATADEDKTRYFQADQDTAAMDITSSLHGAVNIPSQDASHPDSTSEDKEPISSWMDVAEPVGSTNGSDIPVATHPNMEDGSRSQQNNPAVRNVIKQESVLDSSSKFNASEQSVQDKTSDTYTLSSPTLKQDFAEEPMDDNDGIEPVCDGGQTSSADQALEESQMSRKSFLATEDVPVEDTTPEAKPNEDVSSGTVPVSQENTTTQREDHGSNSDHSEATSSAASSNDAVEQDQVAEDPQMLVLKESFVLPDWICDDGEKGILDELPIENDNTEDLVVTAAKRPRLDECKTITLFL